MPASRGCLETLEEEDAEGLSMQEAIAASLLEAETQGLLPAGVQGLLPAGVQTPTCSTFEESGSVVFEDETDHIEESQENPSDGAQGSVSLASAPPCASKASCPVALDVDLQEQCHDSTLFAVEEATERNWKKLPSTGTWLQPLLQDSWPNRADTADTLDSKSGQLRMASRSFGRACGGA